MAAQSQTSTTLEWFGVTTYRLRTKGLTIFLDTWLERPEGMPKFLSIDEAGAVDYIFISHAHFDHVSGADRLAIKSGATVIANCEVVNMLRGRGVPEAQLMAVQGGERIPLFTKQVRDQATNGEIALRPGPPGAPPLADHTFAAMWVQCWPSLHCLMPGHQHIPDFMDTSKVYAGDCAPYVCTLDINRGMEHGLLKLDQMVPAEYMTKGMNSFVDYIKDTQRNVFSAHDGGQLMFNMLVDGKTILWNAHLGAYDGILKSLQPKPDLAILGIAGVANLNGQAFRGTAAQFALDEIRALEEPAQVIWCMQDESLIAPRYIETKGATETVEKETRSKVITLEHAKITDLRL